LKVSVATATGIETEGVEGDPAPHAPAARTAVAVRMPMVARNGTASFIGWRL
jgi:hypothetical protein